MVHAVMTESLLMRLVASFILPGAGDIEERLSAENKAWAGALLSRPAIRAAMGATAEE